MTLIQQMSISMVDLAVIEAEEKWLSLGFEKVAKIVMYVPEEVIERHDRATDVQWGVNRVGKVVSEAVHF